MGSKEVDIESAVMGAINLLSFDQVVMVMAQCQDRLSTIRAEKNLHVLANEMRTLSLQREIHTDANELTEMEREISELGWDIQPKDQPVQKSAAQPAAKRPALGSAAHDVIGKAGKKPAGKLAKIIPMNGKKARSK